MSASSTTIDYINQSNHEAKEQKITGNYMIFKQKE